MAAFCDLHIHSCLSPCADDEMTPWNLVGMARGEGPGRDRPHRPQHRAQHPRGGGGGRGLRRAGHSRHGGNQPGGGAHARLFSHRGGRAFGGGAGLCASAGRPEPAGPVWKPDYHARRRYALRHAGQAAHQRHGSERGGRLRAHPLLWGNPRARAYQPAAATA